jgi:hypothetical protein
MVRSGIERKDKPTKSSVVRIGEIPTDEGPYGDLRAKVLRFKTVIDSARWDLASALTEIKGEAIFHHWGYSSWERYVQTELNMSERTTQYLMSMYHYFEEKIWRELPEETIKEKKPELIAKIRELGWTKARTLVDVVTVEDADQWISKAKLMSTTELESHTRKALNDAAGIEKPVEPMQNKSFRVSEDQSKSVEEALELAGKSLSSDKRGHQLSMVCQDYVATNMAQEDEGRDHMSRYFDKAGALYGVRLIAVDRETGKIVYGKNMFDRMKEQG